MRKKVAIKSPKAKPETADSWVDTREKKKRFTIDISVQLHTKLKIAAAKSGETMAEMVCGFIEEKLGD